MHITDQVTFIQGLKKLVPSTWSKIPILASSMNTKTDFGIREWTSMKGLEV